VGHIWVVEDNATLRETVADLLRGARHRVDAFERAEEALAPEAEALPDLLITDLKLPGIDGLELLARIKGRDPLVEGMVLTAFGTIETAVAAMRAGAFDYLTKPVRMDHLLAKVEQALTVRRDRLALMRERERRRYLEEEVGEVFNRGEIVGRSAVMRELFANLERVSPTQSSILITGESGTGKELVARAIHLRSPRRDGAFVRVNCGALPEGVLESELFGHERGAFTGASRQRRGRFELAEGGTLFLDEIADIGASVQVRLLRVLQEREFERVGGEQTIRADVRVIAATNKDIEAEVAAGRFREDLFYRLYVIPIHLPALRERKEDIALLAEHFLRLIGARLGRPAVRLSPGAARMLEVYDWPGNVRELENALERAMVLCDGDLIAEGDLVFLEKSGRPSAWLPGGIVPLNEALDHVERSLLERAMAQAGGVKAEAARLLGIKTSALYYKLEKYGLL
jgi:two-component system, NtrC family, response regulator HydG